MRCSSLQAQAVRTPENFCKIWWFCEFLSAISACIHRIPDANGKGIPSLLSIGTSGDVFQIHLGNTSPNTGIFTRSVNGEIVQAEQQTCKKNATHPEEIHRIQQNESKNHRFCAI